MEFFATKLFVVYQTALQVWKVKMSQQPAYIASNLKTANTRSGAQGNLQVPFVESDLAGKSFMVRSASTWNLIPPDIRNVKKLHGFKKKLKQWIKSNVELD